MKKNKINRKDFLIKGAGAMAFSLLSPHIIKSKGLFADSKKILNVGLIGSGLRGRWFIDIMLKRNDVNVISVCDTDSRAISSTLELFKKHDKNKPKIFTGSDYSYKKLLDDKSLDAVIIATPWLWHIPMAIDAMNRGKYTGLEVSGAFSIKDCWKLVDTYEKTNSKLMFLENVCYRRDVMAVLNMVKENLFGELIHARCGYQHDLRHVKFNDGKTPYGHGVEFGKKGFSESKWRTLHSIKRNGDIYPTHGIGPIMKYFDINFGNRFLSLSSFASKARGLNSYIVNHPKGGKDHPNAKIKFKLGDIVTTTLSTSQGQTVIITHDTNLPRPYSLGFRLQGTKGIWQKDNDGMYIEGMKLSKDGQKLKSQSHNWDDAKKYYKKYDHPLWKKYENEAKGAGHGGMDFFVTNAFVESAKANIEPPIDVYDAATMLVITPLSERSIQEGGMVQSFPDFTRGKWINRKNKFGDSTKY